MTEIFEPIAMKGVDVSAFNEQTIMQRANSLDITRHYMSKLEKCHADIKSCDYKKLLVALFFWDVDWCWDIKCDRSDEVFNMAISLWNFKNPKSKIKTTLKNDVVVYNMTSVHEAHFNLKRCCTVAYEDCPTATHLSKHVDNERINCCYHKIKVNRVLQKLNLPTIDVVNDRNDSPHNMYGNNEKTSYNIIKSNELCDIYANDKAFNDVIEMVNERNLLQFKIELIDRKYLQMYVIEKKENSLQFLSFDERIMLERSFNTWKSIISTTNDESSPTIQ